MIAAEPSIARVPAHHGDTALQPHRSNADFIAAARADIPWLCSMVRELTHHAAFLRDSAEAAIYEAGWRQGRREATQEVATRCRDLTLAADSGRGNETLVASTIARTFGLS